MYNQPRIPIYARHELLSSHKRNIILTKQITILYKYHSNYYTATMVISSGTGYGYLNQAMGTLSQYPALMVGYAVFTLFMVLIDINQSVSYKLGLQGKSLFEFDLNRISLYVIVHRNLFHWLINTVTLMPLLWKFEPKFGTILTGVTLNLLAVVAAIQYCIVCQILGIHQEDYVIGSSGICFLFFTYNCYMDHFTHPVIHTFRYLGREFKVKALHFPFIVLAICFVLLPDSSFLGHLCGILSGFLLGRGYLKVLYPPSKALLFIEQKLATPISMLTPLVTYYKEEQVMNSRVHGPPSSVVDIEANLPGTIRPSPPPQRTQFELESRVLGS